MAINLGIALYTLGIMYTFTDTFYDKSGREAHQRDALGTPVTLSLYIE